MMLLMFSCQNSGTHGCIHPSTSEPPSIFPNLTNPNMFSLSRSLPLLNRGCPKRTSNICLPTEIRGVLRLRKSKKDLFFFLLGVHRLCKATDVCFFARRYVSLVLFFFLNFKEDKLVSSPHE